MAEPAKTQRELTPAELLLMREIWAGKTTTREIYNSLAQSGSKHPAFTTIATYLQRLELKGFLVRKPAGPREFRYSAVIPKETVRNQLSEKVEVLFDRRSDLLESVVSRLDLPPEDERRIHQI